MQEEADRSRPTCQRDATSWSRDGGGSGSSSAGAVTVAESDQSGTDAGAGVAATGVLTGEMQAQRSSFGAEHGHWD